MKVLVCVVMVLVAQLSYGQAQRVSRYDIERHVQRVPFTTPDSLAKMLTEPFSADGDKVRAIFRWITDNIGYNVSVYQRTVRPRYAKYTLAEAYDSVVESKSLNERVAYSVLRNKVALCNGYARLFKTLCDYAGIPAEIVTGYARTNMGSGKFKSNHTWNAVYFDSAWHLLDATWASGYFSYGNDFVQQYNDYYFLTPPAQLIRSHYPEDLRWTLLPDPPTLAEYRQAPFRPTAFIKYAIKAFKPATGIIEAAIGDTLQFELQSSDVKKDLQVASDAYYDSAVISSMGNWAFINPADNAIGLKTTYTYVVTSAAVNWLHLLYNNDVVLRYRLNVKPKAEDGMYNLSLHQ